MGSRPGSNCDAKALEKMFKRLGFTIKRYNNLEAKQMVTKLKKVAANRSFDHRKADCFACAILSHGNHVDTKSDVFEKRWDDVIFGVDGVLVSTKYLLDLFSDDACPELAGKPRLFFIQACRGEKTDSGVKKIVLKDKVSVGEGDNNSAEDSKSDGVGDQGDSTVETDVVGSRPLQHLPDHDKQLEQMVATNGSKPASDSDTNHLTEVEDDRLTDGDNFDSDSSSESSKTEDQTDTIGTKGNASELGAKLEEKKKRKVVTLVPAPLFKDFLVMYATTPGHFAWRRKTGTWFIKSLTEVMKVNRNKNLVQTLTKVSRKVALDYESNIPENKKMHAKKQVPCIMSMLTKDIYFTQKT
ncbi:uncharacterized protein LOC121379720 [Gigantopelta aegis]|uniref:uncharacterized protein LOC121379720 n=1 Tax=Gigantopelta aegis TaxID=1735272 RepID=UPI001B889EEF|nr:uncharacterized protein LOC121379720 [Gigantopelta aegis]